MFRATLNQCVFFCDAQIYPKPRDGLIEVTLLIQLFWLSFGAHHGGQGHTSVHGEETRQTTEGSHGGGGGGQAENERCTQ